MTPETLEIVKTAVQQAVKETVNGKIDRVYAVLEGQNRFMEDTRERIEQHMERVEPVIKAYESSRAINAVATVYGKRAIFWGQIIGAIGIVYIAARVGLTQLLTWRP